MRWAVTRLRHIQAGVLHTCDRVMTCRRATMLKIFQTATNRNFIAVECARLTRTALFYHSFQCA